MFTKQEIRIVSPRYFKDIIATGIDIRATSRCTGHEWRIYSPVGSNRRSVELWHRHSRNDQFHFQKRLPGLPEAVEEIKSHDKWFMEKRG